MEKIYEEERCTIRPENFIKSEPDHPNITSSFPTVYACKSTLYRQRGKEIPKLPISPQNIVLEGKWTRTNAGDNFLMADDGEDSRIVIFGIDSNINYLAAGYMDGTFYPLRDQFYELYSIHGEINGRTYPLVFRLLPRKSEVIYQRFFISYELLRCVPATDCDM